ncbi:MAG: DUF2785 domain-containing protein [Defluviitaleaceae bacterium]|nr:DUF2785 domain-containing protein [Defluviitaleaceae bacterium]
MEFRDKMEKISKMSLKNLKRLSEAEITTIIDDMLENVATADRAIRYDLIYPTLHKMISSGVLSDKEFSRVFRICLDDDYLFNGLGQAGTDTVFIRAFSALMLFTLLNDNIAKQRLSVPEVDNAFERILHYAEKEADTRGFVEGKGWAFAIAHAADMLQCLVQTPFITAEKFPQILRAVKICLFKEGPYIDGEIDRMATVAKLMMERGFPTDALEGWMLSLAEGVEEMMAEEGASYRHFRINANVSNFLRSLYFQFKKDGDRLKLRVSIFEIIKKFL